MHPVISDQLAEIETRVMAAMIDVFDLDTSALARDMTNFATCIESGNTKAPIAQRGKAKAETIRPAAGRARPVVTRDGGIPLISPARGSRR